MPSRSGRKIELGFSHFYELRKENLFFVDKSMLIEHVLRCEYRSALIPRPRRFGKTLNMSMLKDFFSISPINMTPYFEDLQIWQVPEAREHFQKHPVIFITFKDCKDRTWEAVTIKLKSALGRLFGEHRVIREIPGLLDPKQVAWFDAACVDTLPLAAYGETLRMFSRALASLHNAPVVILIDEYDTPIHNALEHGFYEEAISFFKSFLGAGFKDNSYLFRGVMTGILRVSKENMFSDLNNVGVYSLLNDAFKSDFGFTEDEVQAVTEEQGCPELMPALKAMYNGYRFGAREPVEIYN
ncbi:MAG: AAA family ATPase, partial [Myxococcota bacterium]